jgi:hypothetical protein
MVALLLAPLGARASDPIDYAFRVMLDDMEIGTHEFRIERADGREIVDSRADFDVRLLFVNLYSYEHRDREIWQDGCLVALESRTDDNGRAFAIQAERRDDGLLVDRGQESEVLQGCVRTFSYWDPAFLEQERLLNSQDGSYVEVRVTPLAETLLQVDGAAVPARAWRIEAPQDVDLKVWYEVGTERWLALESVRDGRTVRYLPRDAREVRFPEAMIASGG